MKSLASAPTVALLAVAASLVGAPSFAQPSVVQPNVAQPGVAPPGADQPGADQPGAGEPRRGAGRGGGRGPITLAQYQARLRDRVMRADTDHDGRVSLAEWTAARAERQGGGSGGAGEGRGDPARQFQMMDANGDGFLTPAEIDAVSARRFARLDANHDGVLTPDERMAMRPGGGGEGGAAQPLSPQ